MKFFLGVIVIFIVSLYYLILFQYPKFFFPLESSQGNLTFYFQKEFESDTFCFVNNNKRLNNTCTEIHESLKTSSFYDSSKFKGTIFLTNNSFLLNSFAFFQKHYSAFCIWKIDGRVVLQKHEVCNRMFGETPILISHELTHKLEADLLGKILYSKTPKWLIEGYAEYISHKGIVNLMFQPSGETDYNKYEAIVAYLLNKKNISQKDLFNNPPNYETVLSEVEKWRSIQKQNNL
jgi:hypothetical protein